MTHPRVIPDPKCVRPVGVMGILHLDGEKFTIVGPRNVTGIRRREEYQIRELPRVTKIYDQLSDPAWCAYAVFYQAYRDAAARVRDQWDKRKVTP